MQLLADFTDTESSLLVEPIIEYGRFELLIDYLPKVWNCIESNHLKMLLVRKATKKYFSKFEFLRDIEPEKYLYGIGYYKIKLENDHINELILATTHEMRPFDIYGISAFNKWNLIKRHLYEFLKNQNYCTTSSLSIKC
ncbi:MAG: hypothetical protein LAT81_14350 [Oceanicaulis sp.]|nr:hypothetical protein [Oceanicaulis sp.]